MKALTVKGKLVPAALVAALTSGGAVYELERLEGNILGVYADHLAGGIPTRCAGDTNHSMKVGTKLTSDQCKEINKWTMIKYGVGVLGCTSWENLDGDRLIGLTLFAINVGANGACGSQAVKAINAGDLVRGCRLISTTDAGKPNWSYVNGKYVKGLQNRRLAERDWCERGLRA